LRIGLVCLGRVGQAHGDETITVTVLHQSIDCELREPPAGTGVDTAADSQHQCLLPAQFQLILDEINPATNFKIDVDLG